MSTFPPHPRFHAVSSRLPRLPKELVHEIFNELWIQKILEILCNHDDPYLDECAITHITIGKFLCESKLPEIKQAFRLYLRIRSMHRDHPHPHIPILEKDVNFFILRDEKWKKHQPTDFVLEIKKAILEELEAYRNFQEILYYIARTEYNPTDAKTDSKTEGFVYPDLGGALPPWPFEIGLLTSQIGELFDVFDAAEVKLNSLKQSQLYRMADFLERYPNYFHTCCEKDEGSRNSSHTVGRLRLEASRLHMRQIVFGKQFGARSIFAQRQFFLVPYNRVLRTFLKVIERFPPEVHQYPECLTLVLDGFKEHNPRTPSEAKGETQLAPRVLHTKYSLPEHKRRAPAMQPAFFLDADYPVPRNLKRWKSIWPFAEKDFEWLEGFLSVCGHISSMEGTWTAGQTVAEYWLKHVGQAKA
ncbi:hypothetical protein NMY22_g5479 [Coprinellus aureogranulatus]|nr:hypothetical protein NMY22_g5479 [Coprinellus aureogranulatus]